MPMGMGIDPPYVPLFLHFIMPLFLLSIPHPQFSLSLSLSLSHILGSASAMSCCECESCNDETQILAVILDLDGTLLNTEQATKNVLKDFLTKYGKVLDREKEDKRLGMAQKESAIAIVQTYDLPLTPDQFIQEITPIYKQMWPQAGALPGANRIIRHLHKHGVPFALASNSIRNNIDTKIAPHPGWKESFSVILGSDQVKSGKPSPDIFIEAAKRMGVDAGRCLVIEDSLVGVKAAKAAGMKVVSVPPQSEVDGVSIADSVLHSLLEFQPELWGLPPFEDWVDNALPIEPIYVNGVFSNGLLCEVTDDGPSALPDQVFGLYFGWAKVDMHGIFQVVVGIGWDHCSRTAKRKIKPCLIDGNDDHVSGQLMELSLVGYIRKLSGKGCMDMEILDEGKSIAKASLDLPMFAHHACTPLFPEASFFTDSATSDEEELM